MFDCIIVCVFVSFVDMFGWGGYLFVLGGCWLVMKGCCLDDELVGLLVGFVLIVLYVFVVLGLEGECYLVVIEYVLVFVLYVVVC